MVDYLALARKRVIRPGEQESYRRIFVYARNKKGKTRFALSAGVDNTLVMDPEGGTATMHHLKPYVWPIEKWKDMDECYKALKTGKLTPNHFKQGESSTPFSWVSVDGLTRMNNYALGFVMKKQEEINLDRQPGFVQQRDYGKSGELMKNMMQQFHTLPMNICYTAQERMEAGGGGGFDDDEDSESTDYTIVPDLPKGVRAQINAIVEVIGRLYTVRLDVKGQPDPVVERRLQIGIHPQYDTGYRSDFILPDRLEKPTLPDLVALMTSGKQGEASKAKKKK